ncbi:MAG: hypothetical protein KAT09_08070 [Candidatus Aegiribacteria sp.]|nr:hypothetical protein [Candidatus Aegiribacteria sp.]
MKGRNTYLFRESIIILLKTKWIGPYLLLPPMLAFMVYAESYLSAHGITGIFTLEQRTVLAIWNGSLLLTLIAGIKSCLFFSGIWESSWFRNSLALPVNRSSGFWGPYLAVLSVVSVVFILTTGAVVAALPEPERFPLFQILAESYIPVVWAVSMGAFLGILTTGTAGSMFFVALLLLGFLTGLPIARLPEWLYVVIPPVGRIMTLGLQYPQGPIQMGFLVLHSAIFLMLGRFLYGIGSKRR